MADDRDKIVDALTEAGRKAQRLGRSPTNAVKWLRDKYTALVYASKAKTIGDPRSNSTSFPRDLQDVALTNRLSQRSIGRMYMFVYDPKTKEKLPYYDKFPLILMVGLTEDGFVGLNLHYVFPLVRLKILETLIRNVDPNSLQEGFLESNISNKQIMKNFEILYESSKFPMVAPCFKRYLRGHVRSDYLYIDPKEWPKAILIPTERFMKATKLQVWNQSAAYKPSKKRKTRGHK